MSHSLGALAATLIGVAEYLRHYDVDLPKDRVAMTALGFEVVIGGLTFTGSLMAAAKLQELLRGSPITYKGQNFVNLGLLAISIAIAVYLVLNPGAVYLYPAIVVIPLVFGVMMIVPIGGADMPTVISLLNSYAGLSAAAMGFVLNSKLLIVAG